MANLLPPDDASFEGSSTNWVLNASPFGRLAIFSGGAYEGAQCAGADAPAGRGDFVSPWVAVTPGVRYRAAVALYNGDAPGTSRIYLRFADGTGGVLATFSSAARSHPVGVWQWHEVVGVAPAGAVQAIVQVVIGRTTNDPAVGRRAIDSASIEVIPTPDTVDGDAVGDVTVDGSARPASTADAVGSVDVSGTGGGVMSARASGSELVGFSGAVSGRQSVVESAVGSVAVSGGAAVDIPDVPAARSMPRTWIEAAIGLPSTVEPNRHQWVRLDAGRCVRTIEWEHGRERSLDRLEPGRAQWTMTDPDGDLDPSNTQSPLWQAGAPGVDEGTRVRVRMWSADPVTYDDLAGRFSSYSDLAASASSYAALQPAREDVPFAGFVARIQPDYQFGDETVEIEADDVFAVLAETPLPASALQSEVLDTSTVVRHAYPLSFVQPGIIDMRGAVDGSWSAMPTLAAGIAPFDPSQSTEIVDGGPAGQIVGVNLSGRWRLAMWFRVTGTEDSTSPVFGPILRLRTAAGNDDLRVTWHTGLVPTAAQTMALQYPYGSIGADLKTLGSPTAFDQPHLLELWSDGTTIRGNVDRWSSVGVPIGVARAYDRVELAGQIADPVYGTTRFISGAVSWLVISDLAGAPDLWALGRSPWIETTGERVARVSGLAGFPADVAPGPWPVCAPADLSDSTAAHIDRAAAGDRAVLSTTDTGQPRYAHRPDVAAPTVWFDTAGLVGAPAIDTAQSYGIDRSARRVAVTLGDGTEIVIADTTGKRTPRSVALDTLLGDPDDAVALGNEVLSEVRVPRLLITSVIVEGRDARVSWAAATLKVGDIVGVVIRPPDRDPITQISLVERVRVEQTTDTRWRIEYGLDRIVQYSTWQDVVDTWATWTSLLAAEATWADVILAGSPTPPT